MDNRLAGLNYFALALNMIKANFSRFLNVFAVHSSRDVVKNVACVFCADLQARLRDLCVFCPSPTFKYIIHRCFPSSSFLFFAVSYFRPRALSLYLFFYTRLRLGKLSRVYKPSSRRPTSRTYLRSTYFLRGSKRAFFTSTSIRDIFSGWEKETLLDANLFPSHHIVKHSLNRDASASNPAFT